MLAYRPPFDWDAMLRFLSARAIPGVECVTKASYQRTVRIGEYRGWLSVSPIAGRPLLAVDLATTLAPVLSSILVRLRNLFDLDARPDVIASHLSIDPLLAASLEQHPGLRVPGAFDSFELGMRAILGQQVTVRGATTISGRFAERFGEAIVTPLACLNYITPSAERLAAAQNTTLAGFGLPMKRAESLRQLASVVHRREIDLEPGINPTRIIANLMELPGIGRWTAEYIAMRALRWPDAFPLGDLALMKASGLKSARLLERAAEAWRPWRAYAAMHLWESLRTSSE